MKANTAGRAIVLALLLSALLAVCFAVDARTALGENSWAASPLVKSFGVGGKSVANISTNAVRRGGLIEDFFVLADGRFVVAAQPRPRLDKLTIFRFLPDGSLDLSFGDAGVVRSGFGTTVASLGDGRLLVGGSVGRGVPRGDAAIRRLKDDGSIDRSFGRRGLFRLDLGRRESTGAMVVTSDGKIATQIHSSCFNDSDCVGDSYNKLALLSANGKLLTKGDRIYGFRGYVDITAADDGTLRALDPYGEYDDEGANLVKINRRLKEQKIRDVGKLQIAAPLPDNGFLSFVPNPGSGTDQVVKVFPDGNVDPSFGQDGGASCVGNSLGYSSQRSSIELDPQGRILVSGSTRECQLFRLLPYGNFDGSFSGDGVTELPRVGGHTADWAVAPDPQGRILLAGWDYDRGHVIVRRLTEDGILDNSFGSGGLVDRAVTQESDDQAQDIVSTGGGSTVTVGNSRCEGDQPQFRDCWRFALVKRNSHGRLKPGFGNGGMVMGNYMSATAVAGYRNGDLVVAGSGLDPAKTGWSVVPGFAISRFKSNGDRDRSFGDDGVAYTDLPGKLSSATAKAVAIQPDRRIIVTGTAIKRGEPPYLPVVRYNRDGSLDQTFGSGGVVALHLSGLEGGLAISVLKNGRILIAGRDHFDPVVLRLNPDGSLDRGFGHRGVARPRLEDRPRFGKRNVTYTPAREATSLAVLGSGRMLVGANDGSGLQDGVVFKLKANGRLARNFGKRGIRYTSGLAPQALTVDRCGNLTVSGVYRRRWRASRFFGVTRLTRRGRKDRSFHRGRILLPFGKGMTSRATASTRSRGRVLVAGVKERLMTNEDFATVVLRAGNKCAHG